MGKLDQLNGIAHNLADSFINPTNRAFLYEIGSILTTLAKTSVEIDLLKKKIDLIELDTENFKRSVNHYQKWLFKELLHLKIEKNQIKTVKIRVSFSTEKNLNKVYNCSTTIRSNNNEYTARVRSTYSIIQ